MNFYYNNFCNAVEGFIGAAILSKDYFDLEKYLQIVCHLFFQVITDVTAAWYQSVQ